MSADAYDQELNSIDALIDRDFEPTRWMGSMERVVDAYKREVELLRTRVTALESNVAALRASLERTQDTVKELSK